MDSFKQTSTGFLYNPDLSTNSESELSGILEIHVHHARNIHNICIYDNQDVYAKFSLTYNPDEAISTRIINGGGKNPDFNDDLVMKVSQVDSILKCEIWMLSRAKALMEDQLLGFTLVPISSVVGKGKITQEFSLSSTDLFHSPAGIVKLSIFLNTTNPILVSNNPSCSPSSSSSSISSEVVLLDRNTSQIVLDPVEYSRIEFPEISLVKENQEMVSQYFDLGGSFLQLAAFHSRHDDQQRQPENDYEMAAINPSEEDDDDELVDDHDSNISPKENIQNSWFLSSSMTSSLSDERNSAGSSPDKKINDLKNNDNKKDSIKKEDEERKEPHVVFSAPLGNIIKIDAEQSAMQQQIVDMYMRSMQQFTESLAKMKLPLDLDKAGQKDHVLQDHGSSSDMNNKRKENSRVFYGSRAFF